MHQNIKAKNQNFMCWIYSIW